ncbi:alanine racemase [Leptotrichia sp. oral taxon 221]|uniref:alanine racemase n=1 Tax=Leptotrichia sp. oral taxon 221 TaxID=712362 RepID=UPI001B8BACE8|nr:alanine racemase [Leptotrichia sp. oral taxon 221]QUB96718.1 alanine racemase [Leptotrichia sp. oral taxon 221]
MLIDLEISRNKIEKNLEKIKSINENIIYVLKDDAYGLGIENILPILIENGCNYYAVAYIEEALEIKKISREKFLKEVNVMMLNYTEVEDIRIAVENGIELTIYSLFQFREYEKIFSEILEEGKNNIKIHIKLNTGMNRLGFDGDEIEELCGILKRFQVRNENKRFLECDKKVEDVKTVENRGKLEIVSIFSHISDSENLEKTEAQVKKYEEFLKIFQNMGIDYRYTHLQASPLLFKYGKKYNYDFGRVGMAIYGMEPLSERVGLEQVINLHSKIISLRKVRKGEQVSYGNNGLLERDTVVAIVPIGYAHGLKKQIESSNSYILIKGEKAYILGEVCMDMILVDVTDIEGVSVGDKAVIIGVQGDEEITLLKMAKWANTIQDNILTNFDKSIRRKIVE